MAKYINLEELMKFPFRRNHYDKEHGNEDFICGIETVLEYAENLQTTDIIQEWISVDDRLPEENEYVMIWCGECQIARIEKGISEEQRKAMKRGELDDPYETGWTLSSGYFTLKRSQSYKACDEQGNNRVPYCWYANGGPMKWFGQEVTHWAYLPQPPKGE